MKTRALSAILLCAIVISTSGCFTAGSGGTSTLGNGKIDIGSASFEYADTIAPILDAKYPGAGSLLKGLTSTAAAPAGNPFSGYDRQFHWKHLGVEINPADIEVTESYIKKISGAAMVDYLADNKPPVIVPPVPVPLPQPDVIQQPTPSVPADLLNDLNDLLNQAEAAYNGE